MFEWYGGARVLHRGARRQREMCIIDSSPNSSTQASQVYDSLNDSRMSGALQGLTLMAGGLASPTSIITAMGQSYGDRGKIRDPYSDVGDVIGKLTDKATDTLGVNVGKIGDVVAIVKLYIIHISEPTRPY